MKPKDCIAPRSKKYVHLTERDRYKLEGLLAGKKDVEEISKIMRRDPSTIYREIIRGTIVGYRIIFVKEKNTVQIQRRQIMRLKGRIKSVR